jgi:cytochrome c-type biogenesis protein CcmF
MPWIYYRRAALNAAIMMRRAGVTLAMLASAAFAGLVWSYVTHDFSLTNVAYNVSTTQPLIYKIAGVWSNHEGSMLLWLLVLCLSAGVMVLSRVWDYKTQAWALWAQNNMIALFVGFILIAANPFNRFWPVPREGLGINPLLQDPSLLIHPPMLYAGLVGSAVLLSWAWGAVMTGEKLSTWAQAIQSWVRWIWVFTTGGIALGSLWAYNELGWGGWWFWDPVENASLLPWLVLTALMHSVQAVRNKQPLTKISVWLAALVFPLSTLGTVLTRSGAVTSVHAFAQDATRGQLLGLILGAIMILILGVGWRTWVMPSEKWAWLRHRGIAAHVAIMLISALLVAIGTLAPVVAAWFDLHINITPDFYVVTFVPLMLLMLVILGVSVSQSWAATIGANALSGLIAALTLLVVGIALVYTKVLVALGYGMAVWVAGYSVRAWRRQRFQPWGMMLGHVGLAVAIVGMAAQTAGQREYLAVLPVGGSVTVLGHHLELKKIEFDQGPNYGIRRAYLEVHQGHNRWVLTPEQWFFPVHETYTTETAIHRGFKGDLYTALGQQRDQRWEIRIYWNPLMWCIWLGALLMALGGVVSALSTRRATLTM